MKKSYLFVLILTFFSCSTDDSIISEKREGVNLSNYFPLQIGNSWTYERNALGEWAIVKRTIVDSVKDQEGQLYFKSQWGLINYPPNSYSFEYYYWDNSGLNKFSCGIEDTCQDQSGSNLPPYQELLIKTDICNGDTWNRGPLYFTSGRIMEFDLIDTLKLFNKVESDICDTTFYNVARLSLVSPINIMEGDTVRSYEYYAPNFGLVKEFTLMGNDTIYKVELLKYHLLSD